MLAGAIEAPWRRVRDGLRPACLPDWEPVTDPRQVRNLAARTIARAWHDRVLGLSAEAAFWQLLSLPSLFLALLATLGYFAGFAGKSTLDEVQQNLLNGFSRAFSHQVVDQLIAPLV